MVFNRSVPMYNVRQCQLCMNAPCAASCPHGIDTDRILRSLYFDNEIGAAQRIPEEYPCADCDAPCEKACLKKHGAVPVREIIGSLIKDKAGMEKTAARQADLSTQCCGVKLENPFLLSSSVVASTYEKIARAFYMGWRVPASRLSVILSRSKLLRVTRR